LLLVDAAGGRAHRRLTACIRGEVCAKMCQRRFACPCIALHSTAMAKVRGRRKQLMMQ